MWKMKLVFHFSHLFFPFFLANTIFFIIFATRKPQSIKTEQKNSNHKQTPKQ